MKTKIETRTEKTVDSWGFQGVATYNRFSEFNRGGYAFVKMSDTSSGHGWAGMMHKSEWDKLAA